MAVQVGNGLGRISLVWWGFCGVLLTILAVVLAFEMRSSSRWLAAAPLGALAAAFALHKLTCWLIEGFSGKPIELLIPRTPLYLAAGVAVLVGLLSSNWPAAPTSQAAGPWTKYSTMSYEEAAASSPSPASLPGNPSSGLKPFTGELDAPPTDKWWERYPVVQAANDPRTALEAASDDVIRAYPYLSTPEGVNAVKLIIAERDARIAQGKRPEVALWEAASAIAPQHLPQRAN